MSKREELLEELVEKFLLSDEGFTVKDDDRETYYAQVPVGKIKTIYAGQGFYGCPNQIKLAAIVADGKVYIVSEYNLISSFNGISLPENAVIFDEFSKELNEKIFNEVVKKMYSELPIIPLDCQKERSCEESARSYLIFGRNLDEQEDAALQRIYHTFKFSDIFTALCEGTSLEEEAKKKFHSKEEEYLKMKSFNSKLREIVEHDPDQVTEKWERELAKALTDTTAKRVNVEFLYHGKTASEKMIPARVLNTLFQKYHFSDYDFVTSRNGDNLVKNLGAGRYGGNKNGTLTCEHINKITYGKKVLYQK